MLAINNVATSSDRNLKYDISDMSDKNAMNLILNLKPVTYRYKNDISKRKYWGLIAQNVELALDKCHISTENFAGFIRSVHRELDDTELETTELGLRYEEFFAPIIKAIQNQQKQMDELKADISLLKQ